MISERGFNFTFETVRDWVERFAPLVIEELRAKRAGKAGFSWYTDETYVRIKGEWCYLYRTIDREGQLVETMLSKTRDMAAARRFLTSARNVTKRRPERVTTDGHPAYPKAITETCGSTVEHRTTPYLHSYTEQSHRNVKNRYTFTHGFNKFKFGFVVLRGHEELRNFMRPPSWRTLSAKKMRCIRRAKMHSLNCLENRVAFRSSNSS